MRDLTDHEKEQIAGGWMSEEGPCGPPHTVIPEFDPGPSWNQSGVNAVYAIHAMRAMAAANADGGGGWGGGGADLYLAGGGDQVAVSGLSGEGSYRGVTLSIGVGVEGQDGDNDVWLFLDGGAGIDLRDLSGASVGNLMRAVLGGAGVGGSAFVTTIDQDEGNPNGDFQWGAGANVFGTQLSVDRNGGIGGGGAIGTAQFGASVTGNAALNLTDMAAGKCCAHVSDERPVSHWHGFDF